MARDGDDYVGSRFALLTKHGKAAAIEPVLRREFAASLEVVADFDTDTLGTFTRDVPRLGTQVETARRKAQLAVELSGLPLGLGSEGTFGPGPFGLGAWNSELIVLVDTDRGLEILGRAGAAGHHQFTSIRTSGDLRQFAGKVGFPGHGLVIRPDHADHPRVFKDFSDERALVDGYEQARAESDTGVVWVESDLRAHMNPTRMQTIAAACEDLATRMRQRCPQCDAPGFGVVGRVPGLPCAYCQTPTREAVAERLTCVACVFEERRPLVSAAQRADPKWCDECNP